MFTILVVEDDQNLRKLMTAYLHMNGYRVLQAANGQEALEEMERTQPDLVIADIMMPVMDGYTLTEQIRQSYPLLPVLMVTARETLEDKRRGFSLGVDDYMVKPVDLDELLMRVGALLRRAQAVTSHQLQVGETVLNYDTLTVTRGDTELQLPKKEFYLLYKLLSYPKQIFTRRQLMEEIWGWTPKAMSVPWMCISAVCGKSAKSSLISHW